MSEYQRESSFDELVAGISPAERKALLEKINAGNHDAIPAIRPVRNEPDDTGTAELKLRSESFLYRLLLWIRSFLTKKPAAVLYNADLVESLAYKVNKLHPGYLDYRRGFLQTMFYEKLKELKKSADFFRPYFAAAYDNPGSFYVFLSAFISPEIEAQINDEADPYTIPFEKEPNTELRASLLRRIETILKNISANSRAKLYGEIRSLEWLRQLTELPFLHFLAQFTTVVSDSYTCPFRNAEADIPAFARVLSGAVSVSNEAMEALFLYFRRDSMKNIALSENTEKALRDFLSEAASCFSMIQMFISTVPIRAIGRIVTGNYDWQPEQAKGAEDWFLKFRDEWRRLFDKRWAAWLRDRKKDRLSAVLQNSFGIDSFPELPYRPWATLWGGLTFRCELTGGFLAWFASFEYQTALQVLNVITTDGIFISNDNRTEFSKAVNDFATVNQEVSLFVDSLEKHGSVGTVFDKLESEHVRTLKGQSLADSTLLSAEMNVRDYGTRFCEACRPMERVLHGILDEENKPKGYSSLQNLASIKGRDNAAFRKSMAETLAVLENARSILTELEPLDLPDGDTGARPAAAAAQ